MKTHSILMVIVAFCLLHLFACKQSESSSTSIPPTTTAISVVVSPEGMMRGGKPYFVKGAGGDSHLKELAARGANSIRTWSTNNIDTILDDAHAHGLTVSVGIWLEYECSWFSYHKPEDIAKQTERVRSYVLQHREHPALLAWGLGNEIEGSKSTDPALWQQLDRLAVMIRELDPHHPTFTAIAGFAPFKLEAFEKHAPNLDYLGINTYGGAAIVRSELKKRGLKRPWMLTEWGARGPWESPKTSYQVNLEPTSCQKAEYLRRTYKTVITPDDGLLGSYAFLWGWKHEATATWFGLLTADGHTTNLVDALEEMWTAKAAANRAPEITPITGVPPAPISSGHVFQATVTATEPENHPITYRWLVMPELFGKEHHTNKKMHPVLENAIDNPSASTITVTAPTRPGTYRLYLWVQDAHQHTAIANMPFQVR
jgi:hypothetical protein